MPIKPKPITGRNDEIVRQRLEKYKKYNQYNRHYRKRREDGYEYDISRYQPKRKLEGKRIPRKGFYDDLPKNFEGDYGKRVLKQIQEREKQKLKKFNELKKIVDAEESGDFSKLSDEEVYELAKQQDDWEDDFDPNANAEFLASEIESLAEALLLGELDDPTIARQLYDIAETVKKLRL